MPRLFSYSAIVTKIKGMEAHLLSEKEYETLANMSSVGDLILYLKNNPGYQTILEPINENHVHRGEMEQLLGLSVFHDFAKVYSFATISQRKLLEIFFNRFEIDLLKQILTSFYSEVPSVDYEEFQTVFKKHSKLDMNALAQAESLEEFLDLLSKTEYGPILRKLYDAGNATLYDYESQLDVYYFLRAYRLARKLPSKRDRTIICSILGTQIDFQNIIWIYRSKRFFEMTDTMIYSHIIPIHYRLTDGQMNQLVTASTLDEFLANLEHTRYHYLASDIHHLALERKYISFRTKLLRTIKHRDPLSIASILYYFFEKELEVDHLTTIIECIRYQIQPADILKHISVDRLEEST